MMNSETARYYEDIQRYDEQMPWDVIFKDVYIHACLNAAKSTVYDVLDDIMKIALRQVFPYGRYLLTVLSINMYTPKGGT
jgi:hypothetical protein